MMHTEKIKLVQILNGRLSAIIDTITNMHYIWLTVLLLATM